MSVYVTRFYEVRISDIDEHISNEEKQLADVKPTKDGYVVYVSCNQYDRRYLVWSEKDKEWHPKESVGKSWHLARWYTPAGFGYNMLDKDCQVGKVIPPIKKYNDDDPRPLLIKEGDYLLEEYEYSDNGGVIRDEYLSSHNWNDEVEGFADRGVPSDASDELKQIMEHYNEQYCWGKTYVTIGEWEAAYDKRLSLFKEKLAEKFHTKYKDEINQKLDDLLLLANGKTPPKRKKKKKDEDDDFEYYEDSVKYLWDEEFWNVMAVRREIARAHDMVEYFGWLPDEDIRVSYFMS